MKTPRQFLDLLERRDTPVLFHATNVTAAAKAIAEDLFHLTFAGGTQADNLHGGKQFYLSCSRNPVNDYAYVYDGAAMLVLDAAKLRQKYEIKSVNYWGDMGKDEQEDRLWAHEASIPALTYLREVHCKLPGTGEDRPRMLQAFHALAALKAMPVYFYQDGGAYRTLNKAKAVPMNLAVPEPEEDSGRRNWSDKYADEMDEFINWLENPKGEYGERLMRRVRYHDFWRSAEADVHNLRSYKTAKSQAALQRLARVMRKRRVGSVKDLVLQAQKEMPY